MNMIEKRSSERRPFRCDIQCQAGGQIYPATGLNISEGGLSFMTDAPVSIGAEVMMRYRPREEDPLIAFKVVICWWTGKRVGARFGQLPEEYVEILRHQWEIAQAG